MIIVTTDQISNKSISTVYGLVVVGEGPSDTKTLEELNETAKERISEKARTMGGNAIVGYRIEVSLSQGFSEIICYGTVVLAEDEAL